MSNPGGILTNKWNLLDIKTPYVTQLMCGMVVALQFSAFQSPLGTRTVEHRRTFCTPPTHIVTFQSMQKKSFAISSLCSFEVALILKFQAKICRSLRLRLSFKFCKLIQVVVVSHYTSRSCPVVRPGSHLAVVTCQAVIIRQKVVNEFAESHQALVLHLSYILKLDNCNYLI